MYNNAKVVEAFQKLNWLKFFNKIDGYDDEVVAKFALNVKKVSVHECRVDVKGIPLILNEELLSNVTGLPRGKI